MKVEKDYADLLKLFNKHKVRYCIVGAFAMAFHARPRYTKDMDILIAPEKENAEKILKALKAFGFSSLKLSERDFLKEGYTIQLGYEPVRIDLLTSIGGVRFDEVWKHKRIGHYGSAKAFFIGLDELLKNKRSSSRRQDQADIELLMEVRRKK